MLKLTKETSSENYPILPQTSAVRKLSVKTSVKSVADLKSSYCIVKNNLTTSVNGSQVVRNVSWGCYFDNDNIVEYPATCQVQYAELKIDSQSVEYVEDVNVRLVNLMTYQKNSEQVKKQASLGSYGFQRLENGAKAPSPASATSVVRSVGAYRSPFLQQTLDTTSNVLQSSVYQEVASVIKLSDLFSFCQASGVDNLNLMGREVEVIIQFEDRKQILTEFVNYKAKYDSTAQQVKPTPNNTLAIDNGFLQYLNGVGNPISTVVSSANFIALTLDQLVNAQLQIRTLTTYKNIVDCPLYVGMPICLWKTTAVITKGANYFIIKSLTLDANSRCVISIVPYFAGANADGQRVYIQPTTAGTAITTAQIFAEIATPANPATNPATFNVVSLSGVCDPVVKANTITDLSSQDNGLNSFYYVNGLELVVVEKDVQGMKQTINYVSYMRDSDVIPAGALNYTKSFQIEPSVSAVFGMLPPVLATRPNDGDVNLLSCSRMLQPNGTPYTNGLVMRNMLNGNPLYTRDIVFGSSNNDSVEPLYFHRLYLASQKLGMQLNNLSTVEHFMAKDGVNQHAMICEPVPVSQNPQLLTVRLQFLANTNPRTIYLYKAQMRTVEI